jgi:hypothetical protein
MRNDEDEFLDEDTEPEYVKVKITAEIEVPLGLLSEYFNEFEIKSNLVGEFLKIKSGVFENAAYGFVLSAEIETIPRKLEGQD